MSNHPRRRRTLDARPRTGDEVVSWMEKFTDAVLDPWQEAMLRRMYDRGDDRVAVGVDVAKSGDDTVMVATMAQGGQVWVAPLGTDPPDSGWRNVGFTNQPLDLRPIMVDLAADVRSIAARTTRAITVPMTVPWPTIIRGLEDNVTGRVYEAGLHPASRLAWERVIEGRDADGNPLLVCDHCGDPVPCFEEVLRHMDTDGHRCFCRPTGTCTVTGRPVSELPAR